jgi:hypothetical protein
LRAKVNLLKWLCAERVAAHLTCFARSPKAGASTADPSIGAVTVAGARLWAVPGDGLFAQVIGNLNTLQAHGEPPRAEPIVEPSRRTNTIFRCANGRLKNAGGLASIGGLLIALGGVIVLTTVEILRVDWFPGWIDYRNFWHWNAVFLALSDGHCINLQLRALALPVLEEARIDFGQVGDDSLFDVFTANWLQGPVHAVSLRTGGL